MAPTVTSAAAQPRAGDAAAKACYRTDATAPGGGRNIGGSPTRYKWDHTPYIGARYYSCGRTVDVIYGGARATHYNVRWVAPGGPWEQGELPAGSSVWSWPARYGDYSLTIQACNRGGFGQRSSCTNWSPVIYLNTR